MTDSKSTVHETINSFFPTLLGAIYLNLKYSINYYNQLHRQLLRWGGVGGEGGKGDFDNDNPYIYHTCYMLAVIYMLQLYRACRLVSA